MREEPSGSPDHRGPRVLQLPQIAAHVGLAGHPWLLVNAEPDGTISQGCYLSRRAEVACRQCGFAAHVELSMAYDLVPGAIATGRRVFGLSARS